MKNNTQPKSLLLGANDRAMFSMARQLRKKGFRVEVADWISLPVQKSRFIDKYHRLSNGEKDAAKFTSELIDLIGREKYDLLIPVNDTALEICFGAEREISAKVKIIGLPSAKNYLYSHDKAALVEKCLEIGVPTPKSFIIRKLDDLENLPNDFNFPLMVKPAYSKLLKNNRIYGFTVKKVENRQRLIDCVREHIENCPLIVQEKLDGYGAGYNFLAADGEVFVCYAHERVHEPSGGGQSSYRKTISPDKYKLREYSEKLVKAIGWTGIAMIEYRIDHGNAYIMEINGRLWGSIELGIFGGVNIPLYFLEFFDENKLPPKNLESREVFARNLKLDIRSELKKAVGDRSLKPLFSWLGSFRRSFSRSEIIEDHPFRDFFFEAAVYGGFAKKFFGRIMPKKNSLVKSKNAGDIPQIKKRMKIGFVCFGNICRSPFAEVYAGAKYQDFEFSSFGFFQPENRLSPTHAVECAKEFGVDLETHRSKVLTEKEVANLDFLFVMDEQNFADFQNAFPGYLSKLFYLNAAKEIEDPYNKGKETFSRIYREIAAEIDTLFGKI